MEWRFGPGLERTTELQSPPTRKIASILRIAAVSGIGIFAWEMFLCVNHF
jgi:hypothetical protein